MPHDSLGHELVSRLLAAIFGLILIRRRPPSSTYTAAPASRVIYAACRAQRRRPFILLSHAI